MKKYIFILISAVLLSGCSMLNPTYKLDKAFYQATAQKWDGGRQESGSGIIFRLKFYDLSDELLSDTLWVNNTPLDVEITKVGDTTYISSFQVIDRSNYSSSLAADSVYVGKLNVVVKDKKRKLSVKEFIILPAALYP